MNNNGSVDRFLGRTGTIVTIVSAIVLVSSIIVTNCIRVSMTMAACKSLSTTTAKHDVEIEVLKTKLDVIIAGQKEIKTKLEERR